MICLFCLSLPPSPLSISFEHSNVLAPPPPYKTRVPKLYFTSGCYHWHMCCYNFFHFLCHLFQHNRELTSLTLTMQILEAPVPQGPAHSPDPCDQAVSLLWCLPATLVWASSSLLTLVFPVLWKTQLTFIYTSHIHMLPASSSTSSLWLSCSSKCQLCSDNIYNHLLSSWPLSSRFPRLKCPEEIHNSS